jgi:hypothetical protein
MHVDPERVAALPEPVRRSLTMSGALDRPIPTSVTLTQEGRIKTAPDRGWLPFTAEETFPTDRPGFRWTASVRMLGLPVLRAIDQLADGRGSMRGRVIGLFTAFDETGPHMDQGALVRWLNETMWFPWVWATGLVSWEPVDDSTAVGTVDAGDTSARAEFRFDAEGRVFNFVADRSRGSGVGLTPWSTPITSHRSFDGVELPAGGTAIWHLDEGDFAYIELEVTSLTFEA